MNRLAAELVKGILSEAEVPRKEIIGMFGGGFKPPTLGHLEVVKRALDENPEMDRMVILVGSGERDSITQKEALNIWRIYQKYLPKKVEVQPAPEGKAPIRAIYGYGSKNPDKTIYWFLGAREGNEGDVQDIMKRTKALRKGEHPNIEVKQITTGGSVSGTKARQALLGRRREEFISYLPDIPEVDEIWNMLSDSMGVNEEQNPTEMNDKFFVKKGAFIYHEGKKKRLGRGRYFEVKDVKENRYSLEDKQGRQFWINKHEMCDKWKNVSLEERISFKPEFDETEVDFIEDFADEKMRPDVDIDLSGQHFFDRLNDPRNYPDIEPYELEDFFEKLADKKDEFVAFLKKYKEVVAKDKETNINIPFMKIANRAIAKTIMRKKNFLSKTPILPLEEGRYDAEVTMISRMIINLLKDTLGKTVKDTFEDAGEIDGEPYNLEAYLIPTDFDTLGPLPFIINAAGDEDAIAIQINYNPEVFPKAYNELIPELKDAIRHELEHTSQGRFSKGVMPDGTDQDDLPLFDYLTLDYEIPAFVQGIYKNAKTRKIKFSQALQNFLDERMDELTPDEEAKIKKIYTDWAKKNLPAAQFEGKDPKKGTGKKPKGSGRRLYTDEDPSDTVKVKFSTRQDIVNTLNKTSFKNKSHARQSQVINLIHQRTRAAYNRAKDPAVKKRLKTALDYITKRKEASKAKTQRLKDQKKKTNENLVKETFTPQILSLTQYMDSNGLDLKPYPKIKFIDNDKKNAEDLLGRTAYYDPNQKLVALYTMGRHPKDILRSYAHELIHHHQNLNGTLNHGQTTNTNEDGDLDKIEREAYEQGNILFRNWEDSIKNQ